MRDENIGPYRIVEKIGSGGMGEVFKARDDRLGRLVAIKRIRPGKEGGEETRERFQREARATAQLNHPSIVHVYDIFRDDESDCIVMEYIEGRTLQSLVHDKPLDPLRAAALGREIAEGLAEAHSKNILHRDLKTENVIITPGWHAKILDFGLAKPLIEDDLDTGLTGKGQLVGTSRAMSPEYVGGDEIDERADLFALGVLLYEVTTCSSPFKAQNTLATLKQVIVHHQRPAHERNPEVPVELSELIDQLLEKLPRDRPQSAKEVAEALGRFAGQPSESVDRLSSHTRLVPTSSSSPDLTDTMSISSAIADPRWRRFLAVLAVLVVGGIFGAYLIGRSINPEDGIRPGQIDFREEDRIILGQFDSPTNSVDKQLLVPLEVAFRIGLEQSRYAKTLSEDQVRAALKRMERSESTPIDREVGVELCVREGARALILGTAIKVGETYSLNAEIIDPQTSMTVASASARAEDESQLLIALDDVKQGIRERLGESLASINRSIPLEKVTTADIRALTSYSLAKARMEAREDSEAVRYLENAIEADPKFSMAHAKLAVTLFNLDRVGNVSRIEDHIQRALQEPDRLTGYERRYINGWMANWRGSPEEMVDAWEQVRDFYPEVAAGHLNLGLVYLTYLNDYEQAVGLFRKSVTASSPETLPRIYDIIARGQLALGLPDEASETLGNLSEERRRNNSWAQRAMYFTQRLYEEAGEVYKLGGDPIGSSWIALDQGQFEKAVALAREPENAKDPLKAPLAIVAALEQTGTLAELRKEVENALVVLQENRQEEAGTSKSPIPILAVLGKSAARRQQTDLSMIILNEYLAPKVAEQDSKFWRAYLKILEGEIMLARGEVDEAVRTIRESLQLVDTFQGHESLSFALERSGDFEGAIAEARWISLHRGRITIECSCYIEAHNIVGWSMALFRLGRLSEEIGNPEDARRYYEQAISGWSNGDRLPVLVQAESRLEALRSETGS